MPAHKFALGQKVSFWPDHDQSASRGETFIVVRQLPETAGLFQYQLQSEADGHSRIVRENQLADL
jgi:hypothetical protein